MDRIRVDASVTSDDLVELDQDHPGFRDPQYRRRRNIIAQLALDHVPGEEVVDAPYSDDEQEVWRSVWAQLGPLHERLACRVYREGAAKLRLSRERIPQFAELNPTLAEATDFTLAPVAGLVTPELFLRRLGQDQFLATQYVRHHSRPLYTPEPDVIHELVGHAPTLVQDDMVALNRAFGRAALATEDEARFLQLIRLYWYTVEFGVVREDGEVRAYGAGLLSSFGEIQRIVDGAELVPLDVEVASRTPFDPTAYQGTLFVADGWDDVMGSLLTFLE